MQAAGRPGNADTGGLGSAVLVLLDTCSKSPGPLLTQENRTPPGMRTILPDQIYENDKGFNEASEDICGKFSRMNIQNQQLLLEKLQKIHFINLYKVQSP